MPGFLDAFPVDWTDLRVCDLHGALATSIYRQSDIIEIVQATGLSPGDLNLERPARGVWRDALEHAAGQQRLRELVEQAAVRLPAVRARVDELLAAEPVVSAASSAAAPAWMNFAVDERERQIVQDDETLLDVSFLERGLLKASAVCRLQVQTGTGLYHGTGFRIGVATLLTNHHVLYDWGDQEMPALSVQAEFGYETDLDGKLRKATVVLCDIATIKGEREHDFAVISASEPLPGGPMLTLGSQRPVAVDDRVYIIQHPNGLPKKLAMAHNLVRHVDDEVVQYWTDTDTGSSGSPVFDERWEVVALHHQWVETDGDDGTAFRNQGRNIRRVAQRLTELGVVL